MMAWGYHNTGDPSIDVEDRPDVGFDDGALESPIFDSVTGKYLGNDSEGFMKGDVMFMDREEYDRLRAASENGILDHKDAVKSGKSIADLNNTVHDAALFHSAVDFVSKVTYKAFHGVNPTAGLLNGEISVYSDKFNFAVNHPDNIGTDYAQNKNVAQRDNAPDIDKITINFDNRKDLNTAGNIGSLFEHEYYFHGILNIRNKWGKPDPHDMIYPQQVKTQIFNFSSGVYKEKTLTAANSYKIKG